ncbi:MAG: alpha/beta hydrolase [Verrucomicrobiota bacterium]
MKWHLLPVFLLAILNLEAAEPLTFKLWPEGAPGRMPVISEATAKLLDSGKANPNRVTNVSDPEIWVYKAAAPNGAAVVVAPGGGYFMMSWIHEGTQVCEWLNSIGVTAILLKYRVPTRDDERPYEKPTADALRAVGMARHKAKEWGVDPARIGLLGFSAGGNLLGHAACDRGERSYKVNPEVDDERGPDFGVMIYGGGFLDKDLVKFKEGFSVPADAPPMFFAVAHDDKTNAIELARLYLEYKRHNIPAELHVFTQGGHGFGMRDNKQNINLWPKRCEEWMQSMGYLNQN